MPQGGAMCGLGVSTDPFVSADPSFHQQLAYRVPPTIIFLKTINYININLPWPLDLASIQRHIQQFALYWCNTVDARKPAKYR
jgi:hypothetical protein